MLSGFLGEEKFFNGVHVSFNIRSYSEVFYKVGILESFAKFTGKRQCPNLLFNRVAGHLSIELFTKACAFLRILQKF